MATNNESIGLSSPPVGGDRGINILMTGGGAPGAPGIIKCLSQEANFNIMAVDANPNAAGRCLVKDFQVIPPANDPAFIDMVLAVCRENIHIVLPLVTKELIPLSQHINEFELAERNY
jgi:carbamoyl-phosphate synthase large subunit